MRMRTLLRKSQLPEAQRFGLYSKAVREELMESNDDAITRGEIVIWFEKRGRCIQEEKRREAR